MASKPPPPAAAARTQSLAPTSTICVLGHDLLCETFLRLPSLPSLVRAALTCRNFLAAIRGSPVFRRRFRELHRPSLLGFFFDPDGPDIPWFAPVRRQSDRDLTAAIRRADFFLTGIPDCEDAYPGWQIQDCRGGYLLLVNWDTEQIAAYNPLTLALDLIPLPLNEIADGCNGELIYHGFHLVSSGEAPGTFRVIFFCHDASRVRVAVFSSGARHWRMLPWEEVPVPALPAEDQYWLLVGAQANGCMSWMASCTCQPQSHREILGRLVGSYPSAWKQESWRRYFIGYMTAMSIPTSCHGLFFLLKQGIGHEA
ncbi:hypothetical protein HU200_010020 [Digitaria exilis]|uniref:F-box domain-containing protein n=1 Tax=Digitaria exilis TaxID=1010633 RepID=A0A835KQB8_9POAL|nr:hypothetical protein HU200_010020 [Digitaria exilis]